MPGSIRYVNDEGDLREGDILVLQESRGVYNAGSLFRFDYLIRDNMISITSMITNRACKHFTSRYREGGRYGDIVISNGPCVFDD